MTAVEAEAEATRLGVGVLASHPSASDFDPSKESQWTLTMAVAWIAYRDLDEVREWWDDFRLKCWDWRASKYLVTPDGPVVDGWILEQRRKASLSTLSIGWAIDDNEREATVISVRDARQALWEALREGLLPASGLEKGSQGKRVPIPALEWNELKLVQDMFDKEMEVRQSRLSPYGYGQLLFPSAALMHLWRVPVEKGLVLPNIMPPDGDGYMPLYCAAQWIATEGGGLSFAPDDETVWRGAYAKLLGAIASDKVRVVGTSKGERATVPGYHFVDCEVDYPSGDVPLETMLGEPLYLRSYPYLSEAQWRKGFDDALMNRREVRWRRLMVAREDVRSLWPFGLSAVRSGFPGRPTSRQLVRAELERRSSSGEMLPSVTSEAKALSEWLAEVHPLNPPARAKTIENQIRDRFRELRTTK